MNKQHLTGVTFLVCFIPKTAAPCESFLSKMLPKTLKAYLTTGEKTAEPSQTLQIDSQDDQESPKSVHMKATDFVIQTIANEDLEGILASIQEDEKKRTTNFFEEAQKFQEVLTRADNTDIVRRHGIASLYKGSAFSAVLTRKNDTLHMYTEITTNQKVPYRLEEDNHTKVHAEYRKFDVGWESITSCQTSMPVKEALDRVHTLNGQKKIEDH